MRRTILNLIAFMIAAMGISHGGSDNVKTGIISYRWYDPPIPMLKSQKPPKDSSIWVGYRRQDIEKQEDILPLYTKEEWQAIRDFKKNSGRPFARPLDAIRKSAGKYCYLMEVQYRLTAGRTVSMLVISRNDQTDNLVRRVIISRPKFDGEWKLVLDEDKVFAKPERAFHKKMWPFLRKTKKPTLEQIKAVWAESQEQFKKEQAEEAKKSGK